MTNPNPSNQADALLESLAALEHDQWQYWSQSVAPEVSAPTRDKWQKSWIDYSALSEELKEADRIWARKVITLLKKQNLIS